MSKKDYSVLAIHKYINNINPNINYSTSVYYSSFFESVINHYEKAKLTRDKNKSICLEMFMKDIASSNNVLKNLVEISKTKELTPFRRFYYISIILDDINNSLHKDMLIVTNTFIIQQFINYDLLIDYLPIENEDMKEEDYTSFIKNISYNVNNVLSNSLYKKEDENNYIKKYNNICIKLNEFTSFLYMSLIGLTKIPYLLFVILKSLKLLENEGNLYIIYHLTYINKSMEWIIKLLTYLFDDVELIINNQKINKRESLFLLKCKKFNKAKMTDNVVDIINKLLNNKNILKYNYNTCQFLNYYSSINHKNAHLFDNNFNLYPVDKDFNTPFKPLEILNNIEIDIFKYIDNVKQKNSTFDTIINTLHNSYRNLIQLNNYTMLKYISIKNGHFTIDKTFINNLYFDILTEAVDYFEKHKIPYNKSYLIFIDKFNKNIINQIFNYKKAIKYNLILKKNKTININYDPNNTYIYKYDVFQNSHELLNIAFKVKYDIMDKMVESSENKKKIDMRKITTIIQNVENGFIFSVPEYINKNLHLKYKVDNVFCEILEIYNIWSGIFPIKQHNTSILLLNELSGQGLYASEMFNIYNNILQQYDEQQRIDWVGIGFNKNNIVNKTKYRQQFKNTTTNATILHKKDLKNIHYSINQTGDILIGSIQKWYHSNIIELNNNKLLDIIIADTTSVFNNQNTLLTQKLELATLTMIAGISSSNTNCIVKYRLSYDINQNNNSSGFLINCLYLYSLLFNSVKLIKPLNNNNLSFDFYIVGKGFKEINNENLDKLLNNLDNFEENMCFINQKDIPDTFVEQVGSFINELLSKNINNIEITNLFTTCLLNTNTEYFKKAQCHVYLNKKFMDKLEEDQIKEWINDNNL